MKQLIANSTGHIVAEVDGKRMLVDTGAARTFHDEFQGVRVDDLSRLIGVPLDGVMGMDDLQGRIMSLSRNSIHFDADSPQHAGALLNYLSGVPCVDIKINKIPCRALIKTGATTTYLSDRLLSRDKQTRVVDDIHPIYGAFGVQMFVNYFSIGGKSYFADAGALPEKFSMLSSTGVEAILGTDLLNRFDLVMDFSDNRLHLVSN